MKIYRENDRYRYIDITHLAKLQKTISLGMTAQTSINLNNKT